MDDLIIHVPPSPPQIFTIVSMKRRIVDMATPDTNREFDYARLLEIGRELLIAIGEDPDRPGLQDTPRRFADWWEEFIQYTPGVLDTTFEPIKVDQMIIVRDIPVWSLCEHHLLPFRCHVSIGYIANQNVLGLSKFARIAQRHAHKLQIQERLVSDICTDIQTITGTFNVAVISKGEHLCMTMRGIKTPAEMIASDMRGVFRHRPEARAEFLSLCGMTP